MQCGLRISLLFRGDGLVAWVGTALVVQNIVAGLFNASLVEFTHGWMYIFGVGVLGGTMLRAGAVRRCGQGRARGYQLNRVEQRNEG